MSLDALPFDNNTQQSLREFSATPPAHAWASIAARLPEEPGKDRIAIIWWLFGAGLLLAVSLFGYFSLQTSTSPEAPKTPQKASAPVAMVNQNNLIAEDEEECPPVEKSTLSMAKVTAPSSQQILSTADSKPAATTPFGKTSRNSLSANQVESSFYNENSSGQAFAKTAPTATITKEIAFAKPGENPDRNNPVTSKLPAEPKEANQAHLSLNYASVETPAFDLIALEELRDDLRAIPCEDFRNGGTWSFGVRAFAGPGYTQRDFSGNTSDLPVYLNLRDSVEERQLSIHGGLRFEGVFSKGLFVRAGADYQMYRSRIRLIGPSTETEDLQIIRNPVTGEIIRTDTLRSSTYSETLTYNRHQTIALTAGIGFRKTFGTVSPYIMAEAGYEFHLKSRGQLIDPLNNLVDLNAEPGAWINDRPGLQYGGVIGVDFGITYQLELGVSAHYKKLGGLRGPVDPLDADYSSMFGAVNLRWTL